MFFWGGDNTLAISSPQSMSSISHIYGNTTKNYKNRNIIHKTIFIVRKVGDIKSRYNVIQTSLQQPLIIKKAPQGEPTLLKN